MVDSDRASWLPEPPLVAIRHDSTIRSAAVPWRGLRKLSRVESFKGPHAERGKAVPWDLGLGVIAFATRGGGFQTFDLLTGQPRWSTKDHVPLVTAGRGVLWRDRAGSLRQLDPLTGVPGTPTSIVWKPTGRARPTCGEENIPFGLGERCLARFTLFPEEDYGSEKSIEHRLTLYDLARGGAVAADLELPECFWLSLAVTEEQLFTWDERQVTARDPAGRILWERAAGRGRDLVCAVDGRLFLADGTVLDGATGATVPAVSGGSSWIHPTRDTLVFVGHQRLVAFDRSTLAPRWHTELPPHARVTATTDAVQLVLPTAAPKRTYETGLVETVASLDARTGECLASADLRGSGATLTSTLAAGKLVFLACRRSRPTRARRTSTRDDFKALLVELGAPKR